MNCFLPRDISEVKRADIDVATPWQRKKDHLDRGWEVSGRRKERTPFGPARQPVSQPHQGGSTRENLSQHERHKLVEIHGRYQGFVGRESGGAADHRPISLTF